MVFHKGRKIKSSIMKKVFVLAAIVFVAGSLNAQHISLGPTAGFGHSWLRVEDRPDGLDNKFHSSYNFGAKFVYSIVEHWGVSADAKFSSEGGTFKGLDGLDEGDLTYRANYIRVPIQAAYFFGSLGDKVRPKVSIGPSFGFLVGGKAKADVNGGGTETIADIKDLFESFDLGGVVNAGANFKLSGNMWLNADLGYYHGFTNANKDDDQTIKNSNLTINVGLLFPIGK